MFVFPFPRPFCQRFPLSLVAVLLLFGLISGCASREKSPNAAEQYLTFAAKNPGANLSGQNRKAAIRRISDYLSNLTKETVETQTTKVYSEDAYFNDSLKTVRGAAAIEHYFLETLKNADEIKVEILDVAQSGNDYYLRWTMEFSAPAIGGGKPLHSIGITQVRFIPDGKVLLHQDYWDSGEGLFEHVPVIGPAIRLIKSRL